MIRGCLTLLHSEWPKLCGLTLLHLEWPKLYGVLAFLSATGLKSTLANSADSENVFLYGNENSNWEKLHCFLAWESCFKFWNACMADTCRESAFQTAFAPHMLLSYLEALFFSSMWLKYLAFVIAWFYCWNKLQKRSSCLNRKIFEHI